MVVPQPFETSPQLAPSCPQVLATQLLVHWLATHTLPAAQVGHVSVPPQPSPVTPQLAPACAQVRGVQDGAVGTSPTQAPRSNSMKRRTFSCAVRSPVQ